MSELELLRRMEGKLRCGELREAQWMLHELDTFRAAQKAEYDRTHCPDCGVALLEFHKPPAHGPPGDPVSERARHRRAQRGAVSTAYPPADTPDRAIDWPRIYAQLKNLHAQVRALRLENERLRRLLTEARGRARDASNPPELRRSSDRGADRTGHAGRTGVQSPRTPDRNEPGK